MNWRRSPYNVSVCGHVSMACIIYVVTLFVCAGCSSLRQVLTKEIVSKSMSLDVRDSFFVPYTLLNPYNFPATPASNSMCLDNQTTAPSTSYPDGKVVPIVRHLSVNQVDNQQRTNTTNKVTEVPMSGSSGLSVISLKVIGLFVMLSVCVTVSLIFFRHKR